MDVSRLRAAGDSPIADRLAGYRGHLLLFGTALLARVVYWLYGGTQVIGDANDAIRDCHQLVGDPLGFVASRELLYAGFNLPYCATMQLSGFNFDLWIGIQVLLSAATCVLVFDTARRTVGPVAGWVSGIAFVVLWESFRWIVRPQSELLFTFTIALVLWQLARYTQDSTPHNRRLFLGCLGLMAFTRPFGIPIALGWLTYDLLPETSDLRLDLVRSRRVASGAAILGVVLVLVGLTFLTDRHFGVITFWSRGTVVTGGVFTYQYTPRPATGLWPFFFANIDHLTIMGVLKVGWVFVPVLPRWSTSHIALNALTVAPIILGAIVGIATALRQRKWELIQMWLTPIVAVLVVIGATYLDGGFNYRAQLTPMFVLFTGFAVGVILESVSSDG